MVVRALLGLDITPALPYSPRIANDRPKKGIGFMYNASNLRKGLRSLLIKNLMSSSISSLQNPARARRSIDASSET